MRFHDVLIVREARYTLGIDAETGGHFLSIPVANGLVDYEEYYRLNPEEYASFTSDSTVARSFADACLRREQDDRLIIQAGSDRGVGS